MTTPVTGTPLPVTFFHRSAEETARALLGTVIVSRVRGVITSGRIVETEAYLGASDPASHAYQGRRYAGNQSLYAQPGTWYVYLSYGVHWCANLVCGGPNGGAAVLLRAIEPLTGLTTMRRRRGHRPDRALAAGPGRLTQALGIRRSLDGQSVTSANIVVTRGTPVAEDRIVATPRVGITKAADWPLRYVIDGSPWVSGPKIRTTRGTVPG